LKLKNVLRGKEQKGKKFHIFDGILSSLNIVLQLQILSSDKIGNK